MNPVVLVVDLGIIATSLMLIYGILFRRFFAAGKWFAYIENRPKYWGIFGFYLLLLGTLVFGHLRIVGSVHGAVF